MVIPDSGATSSAATSSGDGNRNIIVTGFMGTGKTTVGRRLAELTGRRFVDMDDVIIERGGMTIPEIFAQKGEAGFRALEAQVCRELAAQNGLVIATGGGALVNAENRAVMQAAGLLVCLSATPDALWSRLESEAAGRPMLANGDWRGLLEKRRAAYDEITHQVDTTGKTPDEVAQEIIELWHQTEST
ncbi:MAG: shikimate kinase [Burkholderiales bacterium]|nr:shikimate kinase [Anaerolineae bacterium]